MQLKREQTERIHSLSISERKMGEKRERKGERKRRREKETKRVKRDEERNSSREANDCDSSNYWLAPKVLGLARLPNGK